MDRKAFLARLAGAASLTLAARRGHGAPQPTAGGRTGLGRLGQLERPLAIAMWDFSWILRHHRLGEFADWNRVLDGLVRRGYNAVRLDCMPQFVASGICTSNFTHPQFPGLWNDVAWHQRLTGKIRGG